MKSRSGNTSRLSGAVGTTAAAAPSAPTTAIEDIPASSSPTSATRERAPVRPPPRRSVVASIVPPLGRATPGTSPTLTHPTLSGGCHHSAKRNQGFVEIDRQRYANNSEQSVDRLRGRHVLRCDAVPAVRHRGG